MSRKKTIVVIQGPGRKGKSSTILNFANLVANKYPIGKASQELLRREHFSKSNPQTLVDIRLTLEINKQVLAIESIGDPYSHLYKRLIEQITKYKADFILCACRSSGQTVLDILSAAGDDYHIVWSSPYGSLVDSMINTHNNIKAKHILDVIKDIGGFK